MLLGARDLAAAAWLVSPLALVLASIAIARRQPALHTALMVVASCFLAAGNVAFAAGSANGMLEPWFAFIVLTVAAERIEFARLTGRRRGMAAMRAVVCLMVASVVTSAFDAEAAGLAFGASIAALGAWLLRFDIARRTWHAGGFARFAATALLSGYAWLIAGGLAWIAWVEGAPVGDLALHALALGFAASMILAHAPIVVPAVARLRLPYTAAFYLPLALLHGSLLMRAGSVVARLPLSVPGAANAVALGAFVIVVATAARPRGRPC